MNSLLFCDASAKTSKGVTDAFYVLTCEVMNRRNEIDTAANGGVGEEESETETINLADGPIFNQDTHSLRCMC